MFVQADQRVRRHGAHSDGQLTHCSADPRTEGIHRNRVTPMSVRLPAAKRPDTVDDDPSLICVTGLVERPGMLAAESISWRQARRAMERIQCYPAPGTSARTLTVTSDNPR